MITLEQIEELLLQRRESENLEFKEAKETFAIP